MKAVIFTLVFCVPFLYARGVPDVLSVVHSRPLTIGIFRKCLCRYLKNAKRDAQTNDIVPRKLRLSSNMVYDSHSADVRRKNEEA